MEQHTWIVNTHGEALSGVFNNKKARDIIIICHGSRGNKQGLLQQSLAKVLSKHYAVFRFDFAGNGKSEGKLEDSTYTKDIDDLLSVIHALKKQQYNVTAIVGHSKSGTEVLLASKVLKTEGIQHIIALSPRINLYNAQEWKAFKIQEEVVAKNGFFIMPESNPSHKINKAYLADIQKWSDVAQWYEESIPTLIIHGTNDEVINIQEVRKFTEKFKKTKLIEILGADHGFSNHLKRVSTTVFKAIEEI